MRILSKKYLCLSVLVMELTSKELADSQELTSMLMEIIDFGFLEKSPNILVLEIRKILTLYDDN
jgi:hypothetical protein